MVITAPNYTQNPNIIVDYWMSRLNGTEFKVLCVLCRKIFGFHKASFRDRISISQMEDITGQNRQSIWKAITKLIQLGLCKKYVCGTPGQEQTVYELIVSNNCDQDENHPTTRVKITPTKENRVYVKDNVCKKDVVLPYRAKKTLTSEKRFRLNEIESETYRWLKSLKLDTGDETLAWWAKTYPAERLKNVFAQAVARRPASLGAYMNKLLKIEAVVATDSTRECAEIAKQFKEENGWYDLEIYRDFVKYKILNTYGEIPLDQEPGNFLRQLEEKYRTILQRRCYDQ